MLNGLVSRKGFEPLTCGLGNRTEHKEFRQCSDNPPLPNDIEKKREFVIVGMDEDPPDSQNPNTQKTEKAAGAGTLGGSQIVRGFEKTTLNFYHEGPRSTSHSLLDKWRLACGIMRDPSISTTAKCFFVLLLEAHYSNTNHCAPSIARIGVKLGRGRDAAFDALRSLENAGWVRVRRTRGSRSNYTFAWERLPAAAGNLAARSETGGEIPTATHAISPQTGQEIPTPTGRENPPPKQKDNRKYISRLVEASPGLIPPGSQPPPAAQSEIRLPSGTGETFDQFWQVFPKKEGRAAALREWTAARASAVPASLLVTGAQRYAGKCATRETRWIAAPANWLRGQRWLDDEPDRFAKAAPSAPPPDDEIARAVRTAKAPRDEATWVFVQEGTPEWSRWRSAFAHARAPLEAGVRRLVLADTGTFERRLGRYFPTPLPPPLELAVDV